MIYNQKEPLAFPPDNYWSQTIMFSATNQGIDEMIGAMNVALRDKRCTKADVMVACAQALGQLIVPGGGEIADVMRKGIIAMIDGYRMQAALSDDE
jgi:hypothetical protein